MPQVALLTCLASAIGLSGLTAAEMSSAQIVPDDTLPVNSQVELGCTDCTIEGGTVRGSNLFHSFQEFSVVTGGEAYFNNALDVGNIFGRVTGDSISDIDGLIRANGAASLYLINPNGIVFGPNSRLDIGGSFTASTAKSLLFSNGWEFSAVPQGDELLSIEVPLGVQFNDPPTGNISSIGSLKADQNLTLSGSQLSLEGDLAAGENLTLQAQKDISSTGILRTGQDLTLSGRELYLEGQLVAGEDLTLQARDTVKIRDTAIDAFIARSGGGPNDSGKPGYRHLGIAALGANALCQWRELSPHQRWNDFGGCPFYERR